MKRPAVHAQKRKLPLIPKPFTVWVCDPRLKLAVFEYRRDRTLTASVHPSTKEKGRWQTTYWRDGEPTGDIQSKTCDEAVRSLPPKFWRLRRLRPAGKLP